MKKYLLLLACIISGNTLINAQSQNNSTVKNDSLTNPYITRVFIDENGDEVAEVIVPGRPPKNYRAPVAKLPDPNNENANVLSNVPAYNWSFGCSATSTAMIAAYYDRTGYDDMYTGPANGGMMPMNNSIWPDVVINGENRHQCPLSATHQGLDGRTELGHVDDYWYMYGSQEDPYYGNWTQHDYGECTADYMGTSQYHNWQTNDGWTTFYYQTSGAPLYDYTGCEPTKKDGCHGFREFIESRGYEIQGYGNFTQLIYGYEGNTQGFTYEEFKDEIDAGRPVMIQVEGHTMVGYGYDDSGESELVYIHDTWDYSNHTMEWGGSYSGMPQYAVTVMMLEPLELGTLAGQVTTLDGSTPIEGATVSTGSFSAVTNSSGNYTISDLPAGTYQVTASHPQYITSDPESVTITQGNTTYQDFSLASAASTITLFTPNGGEFFVTGSEAIITWETNASGNVKIEYSSNNGGSWTTISSSVNASLQTYVWTVPGINSGQCLVKISDASNLAVSDISDNIFGIGPQNLFGGPYEWDENTVLLMHFEGDYHNQSPLSGDGIPQGNGLTFIDNELEGLGKCIELDRSNGNPLITVPHNANLSLDDDWTIETWFKATDYDDYYQYFVVKPGDVDEYLSNYAMQINSYWDDVIFTYYFTAVEERIGLTGVTPALDEWYHMAFIRDTQNGTVRLIIHDSNMTELFDSQINDTGTDPLNNVQDLMVGLYYRGLMDELRISNVTRNYDDLVQAKFTADVNYGEAPLEVTFSDLSTGSPTAWEWDFDNDGNIDSQAQNPVWTYTEPGTYSVKLTVSDDISSNTKTKTNYITVTEIINRPPPQNLVVSNQGYATWEAPQIQTESVIAHHNGYSGSGIGTNSAASWISAARFDAMDLDVYCGSTLNAVNIHICEDFFSYVELRIYEGGTTGDPGTLIYAEDITDNVLINEWTTIPLTSPITLQEGNEYWIGYYIDATGGYPASKDFGPAIAGKGDWMYFNGSWIEISTEFNLNHNWCIEGVVITAGDTSGEKLTQSQILSHPPNEMMTAGTLPQESNILHPVHQRPAKDQRDLLGYNVYLDGSLVENTANLYYQFTGLIPGQTYTAGVTAVYDEGESEMVTDQFTYPATSGSYALLFDGTDDVASFDGFSYPTGDLTLEVWIRPTALNENDEIICGINSSNSSTFQFRLSSSGALLYGESPEWTYITTDACIATNEWYHVAMVKESGVCNLYVNGELKVSGTVNEGVTPTEISIGGRSWNMDRFFSGDIDEVRIWSVARTPAEITENMDTYLTGTETGLSGYWKMNEGAGQIAYDETSNNHNFQLGTTSGTDINDPLWNPTSWPYGLFVDFTADVTTGSAPLTVQFTDLSTSHATSWDWDFENDGTIDSYEQNPEFTYTDPGVYTVSLTISNSKGSDTETKTNYITVLDGSGSISYVTASQRTDGSKIVDVNYNLSGSQTSYPIILEVSFNDGSTYEEVTEVSGDIGAVEPGTGLQITWDAGTEFPAGFYYETVKMRVTAIDEGWECGDLISDPRDGQQYETVLIGDQCWMAENLAWLPSVSPSSNGSTSNPYYYVYGYQGTDVNEAKATANYQTYGVLYNWPAAVNVCEELQGWHLPTHNEWKILEGFADSQYPIGDPEWNNSGARGYDVGKNLKTTTGWDNSGNGTDLYGFSALPAGRRRSQYDFTFLGTKFATWTSDGYSSEAAMREIFADSDKSYYDDYSKGYGFSIRCIKNQGTTKSTGYGKSTREGFSGVSPAFTMDTKNPEVTLNTPNGGGLYSYLEMLDITWIATDDTFEATPMSAGISTEEGGTITWLASNIANIGTTQVDPPDVATIFTKAHVNAVDAFGNEGNDASDDYFELLETIIPLAAEFSADITEGDAPLTVQFTDQSTGDPSSWEWDFQNDGTIDSYLQNPEFTYTDPGIYSVSLTVYDNKGSDTETKTDCITVLDGSGSVSGVTALQRTDGSKLVDITYDLVGSEPSYTVILEVSFDSGENYDQVEEVTGAVGTVIPADDLLMTWDAGAEFPEGFFSETMRIRVSAVGTEWNCGDILTDPRDGQEYETVQIGNHCWMAENLNTGTRIDGTASMTNNGIIEKYCYNNDPANCDTYGGLYQWYEVMQYTTTNGTQGVCMDGWHVSTDEEWKNLEGTVDSQYPVGDPVWDNENWRGHDAGLNIKTTSGWQSPGNGTDLYGFSALPGGFRYTGSFQYWIEHGNWFTSTPSSEGAYIRSLSWEYESVLRLDYDAITQGFSVRCVKDPENQPPAQPSSPNPEDGFTNQDIGTSLSWTCTDPESDPLTFDVYFGTSSNPPQVATGQSETTYDPGTLDYSTEYFWKIVAHDDHDNTAEGPVWSFTTAGSPPPFSECGDILTDSRDGQTYETVLIGDQCWMAENLAWLPSVSPSSAGSHYQPYYYVYGYQGTDLEEAKASETFQNFGALYNWEASMISCPDGWELPTDDEWKILEGTVDSQYPVGSNEWNDDQGRGYDAGKNLKTTTGWDNSGNGTDLYGFSGWPAGRRRYNYNDFVFLGTKMGFWSATATNAAEAWNREMFDNSDQSFRYEYPKAYAFSLRCIKNIENQSPDPPSDPNPANGATGQAIESNLSWTCTDPDEDPLTFDVYFGTTPSPPQVASGQSETTYDLGTLDYNTGYYWRIVAHDDQDSTTQGPLWSFTTLDQNLPPAQPSSPNPGDGATDQTIESTLSWTCTDPETDPLTFDVYFGASSSPPQLATGQSETSYDPGTLEYGTEYFWKIVAHDDHDHTTEGPVWSFTTLDQNLPPAQPSSPNSEDGATAQGIESNLVWSCTDPETDPLTFDVYFGTSSSPPQVVTGQSGSSYDPGTLDFSTEYFWKIVAHDDHSNTTQGPVWSFTTSDDTPPFVECGDILTDPRDGQTYETLLLGDQCWMAENLNYETENSWCYDGEPEMCDSYGRFYEWEAALSACPPGWHLPTADEYCTLLAFVDPTVVCGNYPGYQGTDAGYKLKSDYGWEQGGNGSDEFGFTALPAGITVEDDGALQGYVLGLWSSTLWSGDTAYICGFGYEVDAGSIGEGYSIFPNTSFSARCLKDSPNSAPATPSNPVPENGSTNQATTTTLSWTCTDPDEDPLTFDVYFGTSTNPPQVATGLSGSTFDPGTLDFGTEYFWKIVAHDDHSNTTQGPVWSFTTLDQNLPPAQPSSPNPGDGAIDQAIGTNLSWTCTDPETDPLTYDVYFGTSSSPPQVATSQSGTGYDPGTLDYSTEYFWKIVAHDDHSNTTEGPVWSFTTLEQNLPPAQPSSPNPGDGATAQSIESNLAWSCTDPETDPLTFDVYFGTSSSPTQAVTGQSGTSYDPGTLDYSTEYFWKIVAHDDHDNTTEGPVWSFTTADEPGFTCGDLLIDPRDGQEYETTQIGDQCWMAENLNIGERIEGAVQSNNNGIIEKYCYDNDPVNCETYGGLYQWDEMMQYVIQEGAQGICPEEWHVPTDNDWKILEGTVDSQYPVGDPIWNELGSRGYDVGLKLKSTSGWDNNGNGTDLYSFSALPAGYHSTIFGSFDYQGTSGFWWSSTEHTITSAWDREFSAYNDKSGHYGQSETIGISVRCLRD